MDYLNLKKKHEDELNDFPMVFAFSNKQLEKGMKELGLSLDDTDQICATGAGGYIKKSDSKNLSDMFTRQSNEMSEAIKADTTGNGFIFQMFDYELSNFEYCITRDMEPTREALGLSVEDIEQNPNLLHGLKMAIREQPKYG